ncbi:SET and MYND domain-containing protein 4-like [Vespa mandarinia]|uniref:SET and MYND domain-containing protein 4-like n=1 Tax=Vespa mandarinia TaxID=7446 RepID=UPI00160D15B4|nr:SET and MYND domain-containing protein 4-like [Vespa mandarinia]
MPVAFSVVDRHGVVIYKNYITCDRFLNLFNMANDYEHEISNYFRSNLLSVRNAISQKDFKIFDGLRSNADRVAFILSYPEAHRLSFEVENLEIKNNEKSLSFKNTGNKFFGQGEYPKALKAYSNAVLLAPQNDLSVILANRSAALYHMGQHEHSLNDIEEAIRLNYPEELRYKIEERRARCYLALKMNAKAIDYFRIALKSLDRAKITAERKNKLETDIRVMLTLMEKGERFNAKAKKLSGNVKESTSVANFMPKIDIRNPLYPACSNAVKIIDDGNDIGRHAVATRNISPGEFLIIERPHCALLLAEYRLNHCHLCFTRIFVPMPAACNICSCIAYCSTRCRDKDAEVHLRECNLLPPLWLSKASITCFLALRALLQRPFVEFVEMKERLTFNKEKRDISEKRPYNGDDYESFYDLVTHEDERSNEDIFHRAYIAAWLLRLMKTTTYLSDKDKTPDSAESNLSKAELLVAELLLHHLQLLQFNSHEISELTRPTKDTTLARAKSIFIGGGVYPTVALLNHSCNPGVVRYFIGTTIVVRAIRTIEKGEEISENYGPIFTAMPENERKRNLRVQYWFDCKCEACTNHWPMLDEIDPTILRFKCDTGKSCGNILPIKTDTNEFMINCPKCGKGTNLLKGLKALQDTDMLFKMASRHLECGEYEQALRTYLKILILLDETLSLPIRDYHLCQQGVRLCMLALGNITTT